MPPFPSTVPLSRPNRRFSQGHIPQPVYLGLDVVVSPERDESHYTISVHDGSYTTDYYFGRLWEHPKGMSRADCIKDALSKLGDVVQMYALAQDCKVQLVACSYWVADQTIKDEERPARSSMSAFWRDLDALPFVVETHGETSDERASAAVRKSVMWLTPGNPGNLPRVFVGFRHEVEVDFNYQIHMVDLLDYKTTVCDETWRVFQEMVKTFKERNLRVSFFSSTPQGGGVALMRHALLRFLHLNGVDVHWYVARPKPEIFDITKRKFHNVMQGVAPEGVCLSEADEQAFVDWSEENVNRFWLDSKGPIKDSDVVVIDDPQVTGIIPLIRKYAPETKIIFRSHIEMRADLIRQHPNGPQARTWSFLWNFIKEADLFIAHPVENFIPDQVPRHIVVLMPACTDPLDGLNKHLPEWCGQYYQRVFNRVCLDQGAQEVDWTRPYIVQVARFDPSKGIPDCLEAYGRLRLKLAEEDYDPDQTPQLVICGHGSIDDPEGTVIYEHTHAQLADPNFAPLAKDIIVARLPPSDQLLNVILRNARVALQLSYREGFEVKVTEALHKGVPVVAYEAGGIPLQIQGDKNGFLIPVGEIDTVMEKLYSLVVDDDLHARMSEAARTGVTEEYFTVWNTMNWLHLWIELTNKRGVNSEGLDGELDTLKANSGVGGSKKASALWQAKYNYNPSITSKQ